jgi:hypothetical protein
MFRAASGIPEHKRGIIDFSTGTGCRRAGSIGWSSIANATGTELAFADYFRVFDEINIVQRI